MGMLYQFLGSAAAVALLVALAAWARIARPTPPLDEAAVRRILADEYPSLHPTHVWVTGDATAAVARAGEAALLLLRHGDGYTARKLPWADLAAAKVDAGQVRVDMRDIGAPRFVLAWPAGAAWPPEAAA